jgi:hypothetical protein
MQRVFGLSPVGTGLFLDLLQRDYVNKSAVAGMEAKTVDVHLHHMRARLKPHRIAIQTIWGVGYRFEAADRRKGDGFDSAGDRGWCRWSELGCSPRASPGSMTEVGAMSFFVQLSPLAVS